MLSSQGFIVAEIFSKENIYSRSSKRFTQKYTAHDSDIFQNTVPLPSKTHLKTQCTAGMFYKVNSLTDFKNPKKNNNQKKNNSKHTTMNIELSLHIFNSAEQACLRTFCTGRVLVF